MPIRTQNDLPAKRRLERENIFVVDEDRALHQDIRPIEICIQYVQYSPAGQRDLFDNGQPQGQPCLQVPFK